MVSTNPEHSQATGLWPIRRHIVAVILVGLSVFVAAAVLLWLALGLPAAHFPPSMRTSSNARSVGSGTP